MKQGKLFGKGEEIVGFTVRRFVHVIDADVPEDHPFLEVKQRTDDGPGRALSTSVLGTKAGRRIGRRYKDHIQELKDELGERIAKFPEGLIGTLGELCLFGAIGSLEQHTRGKKYLGYLIEGEAKTALRMEQAEILDAFDLPGREVETPHLTIYDSLTMSGIVRALERYKAMTPESVIPITLGEPRVIELNKPR